MQLLRLTAKFLPFIISPAQTKPSMINTSDGIPPIRGVSHPFLQAREGEREQEGRGKRPANLSSPRRGNENTETCACEMNEAGTTFSLEHDEDEDFSATRGSFCGAEKEQQVSARPVRLKPNTRLIFWCGSRVCLCATRELPSALPWPGATCGAGLSRFS